MQYLVVIERGPSSYGAYVPDLPGCVAVGESREEVEGLIHIDPQGPAANRLRPGATARDHE
jgi:hypothetical protein